jgi:hypothetical protein
MRREETDFNSIPSSQQQAHENLMEWGRWCGSGRTRAVTHPMFRNYTPYLYPEVSGGGAAVDILLALAVQRAFVKLPERQRAALAWAYCFPFVHPGRVQRQLAVTRDGLAALLSSGRVMIANTVRQPNAIGGLQHSRD